MFRKQREWISNYLSELSTSRGATSRADLKYVEKNIQRIEADLKSNNKPTFQSLQSGRNRRTVNEEKMTLGVTYVTERGILRNNVGPLAGFVMSLVIRIKIAPREKKGEEAKAGEEEETSQILVREDSQRKEEIHHMQRREVIKNQTGITEQGMTVQTSLALQTLTDLVDQDQDQILAQKEEKILLHEERNQKIKEEDQTKTDTMQ